MANSSVSTLEAASFAQAHGADLSRLEITLKIARVAHVQCSMVSAYQPALSETHCHPLVERVAAAPAALPARISAWPWQLIRTTNVAMSRRSISACLARLTGPEQHPVMPPTARNNSCRPLLARRVPTRNSEDRGNRKFIPASGFLTSSMNASTRLCLHERGQCVPMMCRDMNFACVILNRPRSEQLTMEKSPRESENLRIWRP